MKKHEHAAQLAAARAEVERLMANGIVMRRNQLSADAYLEATAD